MITPALLISAAGTLVLSTSNRLGRVVDRVRTLADLAETLGTGSLLPNEDAEEKRRLIFDQLEKLSRRIRYLVSAISTLYLTIGLLVASSISVGVVALVHWRNSWMPVALGLIGAVALLHASILLVREALLAVDSTLHEMTYVRKLVARKSGYGQVRSPL